MKKDKSDRDFEDDGRSVADMSEIDKPSLFTFRSPPKTSASDEEKNKEGKAWEPPEYVPMSKEDRRPYLFAAVGASLLIVAVFLVAAALLIWLMTLIWR